ncbi:MAG: DUF2807 domain-containing protein [Altibacter sp.]|uniref:head GIN domain-containing protein n=1 Tax=Altibacter sp. TaxID=2024823 RepID=UPI001D9D01B1|nr:head GIN domain-containing protein [Altibacter sp.]MBZ0326680.1 DUF2807 domain-containing protein [Altibacter sp.]
MNTLVKITLAISLTLLGHTELLAQWGSKKVVGNGNVVTKTVNTSDYAGIQVVGSMDVHLQRGAEGTIAVTTDENLQEYIIVEVKENNMLVIRTEKNTSLKTKKGIHITVPYEDISEVSLVGSGDIDSKDTITASQLEVSLTGSGDMVLTVDAADINAKLTGSGDLDLSGKAANLEIKISGSGDYKGASLIADNVQAYVSGSGDAKVYAKKHIKARVNGSGDIRYAGNPEKSDTKVSGSGTIKSM